MRRGLEAQEELAAIGVLATIGHAQDSRAAVLMFEILVLELVSVY